MTSQCTLCGKVFRYASPKSFTGTMRKHRDKSHPDHKGPIRYSRVEAAAP